MKAAAYDMYAQSMHESAKNLATMHKDYPNIQIMTFPKEVMQALRAENNRLINEFEKKDPLTKELIDSQRRYLKQIRAWTKISDQAYINSNQ